MDSLLILMTGVAIFACRVCFLLKHQNGKNGLIVCKVNPEIIKVYNDRIGYYCCWHIAVEQYKSW